MAAAGRRGNQELELIHKLDETYDEITKLIQENEKQLSDEDKSNSYEQKINTGRKIAYGQRIMLRHMFSGLYLTFNAKKVSQEYGCIRLQLSPANEDSWFTLAPSENIK
jgi:hypothetical protein